MGPENLKIDTTNEIGTNDRNLINDNWKIFLNPVRIITQSNNKTPAIKLTPFYDGTAVTRKL